jgi:gluconate 5-dehydrogenase
LVTGAARGVGRAAAEAFAERGHRVAVLDTDAAGAAEAAAAVGGVAVCADISDAAQVERAMAEVERAYGTVDVLVNNVGMITPVESRAESIDLAIFRRVVDVNLVGTFQMAQRAGRAMIARGTGGTVVNVASIYGERAMDWRLYGAGDDPPRQDDAAYHITKAAVIQMTRILAVSWATFGIRVVSVSPGPVDTELVRETIDTGSRAKIAARIPVARLGEVDEVAKIIAFAASPDASYVTGANIVVDGGWTCW